MESIFLFNDYKGYLKSQVQASRKVRGYQGQLAAAAGCQASFLSKVLHGPTDLTQEHAAGMAAFWRLRDDETEWFLGLVNLARAGTPALRAVIRARLDCLRRDHEPLVAGQDFAAIGDEAAQSFYYSAWYVAAIHVLISVPRFQQVPALARHLKLDEGLVLAVLQRLKELRMVERHGERWKVGPSRVHTSKDSVFAFLHHTHWRARALAQLQNKQAGTIHFTSLYSLSRTDAERIRHELIALIRRCNEIVQPSAEETGVCLNLDFFEV